ncbi:50S ribosomal protein L24 [Corticicoccus populi]|uniref:Large ribosomal subunit protein uL24 n=1 Tax=Corticicoccus populi TaxID=1812821 RepID=A0ABW5WY41_9STAP
MHVRTGDKVVVISGKDKGKQGTILKAIPSKDRVVVEGVNMIKKHQKPSQMNPEGGILETEAPIHVSNVMHVDPETGERTRVRHEIKEDGTKVKIAAKSGKEIPTVKYEKN